MLDDREKARLLLDLQSQSRVTWAHFEKMSERRAFLEWLRANAPQPVVPVSFASEGDPWERILAASRGAGTVLVSGDELLWGPARDSWRRAMNLGRDAISELSAPVVILADAALLDEVAQRAPDLWSWRGSVIEGDYEPWTVEPSVDGSSTRDTSVAWATIKERPDLFVLPGEGTPFREILGELSKGVPASGVLVPFVRGAGAHTLGEALAKALEDRFVTVDSHLTPGVGMEIGLIRIIGALSRVPDAGLADLIRELGRDLTALLGAQLAEVALAHLRDEQTTYAASQRLGERLARAETSALVSSAFRDSQARFADKGSAVLVFHHQSDADRLFRTDIIGTLRGLGVSVFEFGSIEHGVPRQLRLDASMADGTADAVVERRFSSFPAPLRGRIVHWADGLPGLALQITRALAYPPVNRGVLTRADVDAAAHRTTASLDAGTDHEQLLAYSKHTGVPRGTLDRFIEQGFVRLPQDGGPAYFHPLWLAALGRESDPDGPRVPVPEAVFDAADPQDEWRTRLRRAGR